MADVCRWEQVEIVWIDKTNTPGAIASMFCPACRRYTTAIYHYGDPTYLMNYCPHCGDRMKLEGDNG